MKSTLKIGFIVAALCVMKKMVTLLQVFHLATEITNNTKSDDSISTIIDSHDNVVNNIGCLNAENYLNRRYYFQILMESDHHFIGDDAVTDDDSKKGKKQRQCCVEHRQPITQLVHREYRKEDVVRCVDSLLAKRNQRPMHIAFVGDSTVRQHYTSFIRVSYSIYRH